MGFSTEMRRPASARSRAALYAVASCRGSGPPGRGSRASRPTAPPPASRSALHWHRVDGLLDDATFVASARISSSRPRTAEDISTRCCPINLLSRTSDPAASPISTSRSWEAEMVLGCTIDAVAPAELAARAVVEPLSADALTASCLEAPSPADSDLVLKPKAGVPTSALIALTWLRESGQKS